LAFEGRFDGIFVSTGATSPILLKGGAFFIQTVSMMRPSTKEITTIGICIALAVAAGYALIHVPNVELITSISFLSGLLLGSFSGALVGTVSMLLYSLFNPLGVPFIPVLIAQVLFMGLAGFVGGLWRIWMRRLTLRPVMIVGLAGTGLTLTFLYDVGTNVGFALSAGLMSQVVRIIIAGIAFSFIHLVSNTLLFAILIPAVMKVLKIDEGDSTGIRA
jgi:uncharacterized membrane protein